MKKIPNPAPVSPSVSPPPKKDGRGRPKKGYSLIELSDRYGVDRRTIQAWKRKGYPVENEAETRALVAKQQKGPEHMRPVVIGPDGVAAGTSKERRENIQYEILRFKLEKDKGLHVPIDAVRADGARIGATLAAIFEGLPAELAPVLEGKAAGAIHKVLTERLRQIRFDIAAMADVDPVIPE